MVSMLSLQVDQARRSTRSMMIIDRYSNGDLVQDIADEFECTRHNVLRLARAAGLPRRARGFPVSKRQAIIKDLKAEWYYKEIAFRHKVSEAYISIVAKDEGLNRYKRSR